MQRLKIAIVVIGLIFLDACAPVSPYAVELTSTLTTIPNPTNTNNLDLTMTPQAGETVTAAYLASNRANASSTAVARATIRALTPSRTPRPTRTSTQKPDFSKFANVWKRFSSEAYGVSFKYPAVYDESPYKSYGCSVTESTAGGEVYFYINRIVIGIFKPTDSSLPEYVDEFIETNEGQDFTITSKTNSMVGGEQALTLEYRFGELNRYGVVSYFKHGGRIFGVDFTAGVSCEMMVPEDTTSGVTEFGAYTHILESFQFDP